MGFPGSSDWPGSIDTAYGSGSPRVDNVDVVWDDDFNFPDIQIRQLQTWLGTTGDLIGDGIASAGPGGMVSPIASGATAFQLAARNAFAAGKVLSAGDNYDAAYVEKMYLDYAGILWALGGADLGSGEFFRLPHGNALPASFDLARLFHKDDEVSLYATDGSAWWKAHAKNHVDTSDPGVGDDDADGYSVGSRWWNTSTDKEFVCTDASTGAAVWTETTGGGGGAGGKEMDWVDAYSYTQVGTPIEETVCFGYFDATTVTGTIYFWSVFRATLTAAGSSQVRLYDVGPAAGPPAAPTLITTLSSATSGGPQHLSQSLTVGGAPAAGQIANSARMYEVRAYQTSTAGDSMLIGSGGMADR